LKQAPFSLPETKGSSHPGKEDPFVIPIAVEFPEACKETVIPGLYQALSRNTYLCSQVQMRKPLLLPGMICSVAFIYCPVQTGNTENFEFPNPNLRMKEITMLTEKFFEVIHHEGVVSIVSSGKQEAHVVNTWNSYLHITDDGRILIPAAGMHTVEADAKENKLVKLTMGSREVQGLSGLGAGFRIEGNAKFLVTGTDYQFMKEKFPFLTRVLEITITASLQTL
jgi:hypothetical protein